MGQTIRKLASEKLDTKPVFNDRFVIEVCEQIHFHYRNLRLVLSLEDFKEIAKGAKDALDRWSSMGEPAPKAGTHIELCRKQVASNPKFEGEVAVNLNKNLYAEHDGKIFAEGAGLKDKDYIHLKVNDIRLELRNEEFEKVAKAVSEAKESLCLK